MWQQLGLQKKEEEKEKPCANREAKKRKSNEERKKTSYVRSLAFKSGKNVKIVYANEAQYGKFLCTHRKKVGKLRKQFEQLSNYSIM